MVNREIRSSKTSKWGWGILLGLAVLVALNGVGWFFMGPSLSSFEEDTGIPLSEFQEAYPTAAQLIGLQARNTAILLVGFGLLSLAMALAGRRGGSRWVRWAGWVPGATLVGVGLSELTTGATFGLFYLVLGAIALMGRILAGRELAPDRDSG